MFQLRATLLGVQETVKALVAEAYHASSKQKLAFVAISSVGATSETGASSIHRQLRHREKLKQRLKNDVDNHRRQFKPETESYGEALRHIVAIRLPGDGNSLSLVKIPIVATPTYYKGFDNYSTRTPNFRDYWGWLDFGKCVVSIDAEDQEIKSTNGRNYIYWIEDDRLPWNQYLKRLLSDEVAAMPVHRKFWCGDVFIVKVDRDKKGRDLDGNGSLMFIDINEEFMQAHKLIQRLFARYLKNEMLETR